RVVRGQFPGLRSRQGPPPRPRRRQPTPGQLQEADAVTGRHAQSVAPALGAPRAEVRDAFRGYPQSEHGAAAIAPCIEAVNQLAPPCGAGAVLRHQGYGQPVGPENWLTILVQGLPQLAKDVVE